MLQVHKKYQESLRRIVMNQEVSSTGGQIESIVASLNEAYAKHELDSCRALELKDSFDEQTTCLLQWGPMMRT